MKNFIRGMELTIIASPLVGLVAIRMNRMIMSGGGADCICLVIGLVGSVAFVGLWVIASMASNGSMLIRARVFSHSPRGIGCSRQS